MNIEDIRPIDLIPPNIKRCQLCLPNVEQPRVIQPSLGWNGGKATLQVYCPQCNLAGPTYDMKRDGFDTHNAIKEWNILQDLIEAGLNKMESKDTKQP